MEWFTRPLGHVIEVDIGEHSFTDHECSIEKTTLKVINKSCPAGKIHNRI